MIYVLGILLIIVGAGMLLMPDLSRKLDRFSNSLHGRESYQSDAYEFGRVIRAIAFVGAGVAILLMPVMIR